MTWGWHRTSMRLWGDYLLLSRGESAPQRAEPVPSHLVLWELQHGLRSEPRRLWELQEMLGGDLPSGWTQAQHRQEEQRVLGRLTAALRLGALLVFRLPRPAQAYGASRPRPDPAGVTPPDQAQPGAPASWVEVRMVGEDDEPLAGQGYRLLLPGLRLQEGRLDAEGRVRVDGLPEGSCTVSFPGLDSEAWESIEPLSHRPSREPCVRGDMPVPPSPRASPTTHQAEPGDDLHRIAMQYGHYWHTLWKHPHNAGLLNEKRTPDSLVPGDGVYVPALRQKHVECLSGRVHYFRRRGVPVRFIFTVATKAGKVFKHKRYMLEVGPLRVEACTDAQGRVLQWVSPLQREARLTVWLEEPGYPSEVRWNLSLGYLEPLDTHRGLVSRLTNLGYDCGGEEHFGPKTQAALSRFQEWAGLEHSGQIDDRTRQALRSRYGQ